MDHRQIAVETVVASRRSIRRFLDTPVSMAEVRDLIIKASRAPSGTNFQPWKVVVVAGETKRRLSAAVIQDAERGEKSEEYAYAPSPVPEPYLSRRRAVGYGLYNLYGIARDDYVARKAAMLRNFEFFGAPVGLFFVSANFRAPVRLSDAV
ncbi:nitroreductase family protein [Novosphingobium resinovorum]|nr:nitroreductase family protein [Novosphingobium resinovorum]WJM26331.1 nitroreductase family protein [Novosphingobium resinovorum]